MKLKNDFVTNSSSASYLVFIPDDFDIDKFLHLIPEDEINSLIEDEYLDYYKTKKHVLGKVKKEFKQLINDGVVYCYEESYIYYMISKIVEELDLVIDEPETGGGDESGIMINIGAKVSREKLKNILSGGWGLKHGGWGIETKI